MTLDALGACRVVRAWRIACPEHAALQLPAQCGPVPRSRCSCFTTRQPRGKQDRKSTPACFVLGCLTSRSWSFVLDGSVEDNAGGMERMPLGARHRQILLMETQAAATTQALQTMKQTDFSLRAVPTGIL